MKTIGVRNLKATLSSVLRDVQRDMQRGDVYLVTDRGHVVAELRSPDAGQHAVTAEDRAFARLASAGHLRVAERPTAVYPLSPLRSKDGLAVKILDEALAAASWNVMDLSGDIAVRARATFPQEPVRTLDAVHLATAQVFHDAVGPVVMLSLDERVTENAKALGLSLAAT